MTKETTETKDDATVGGSLLEAVVRLRYSTETPTETGWWWQRDCHRTERCLLVHKFRGKLCLEGFNMMGGRTYTPIKEDRTTEWAGPIQKPE